MTVTQTQMMTEVEFTESEQRKPPLPKQQMPSIFDEPTTWNNFHKHVNWPQSILLLGSPLLALYGFYTTEIQTKTALFAIAYYFFTGLGITAGYHRLWSHRAYCATTTLKWIYCLMGSGAVEGSIYWWSRGHRAHHRWTDTDKDPYSAHRGFFFAHLGWMLVQRPNTRIGYADVADLKKDPVVAFQHRHYVYFALAMGFLLPTLVAGLGWGDFRGGFYFAAIARLVFVHHATFCVNSLAHFLGEDSFDDHHTPRDHWVTALVTMGEGYHNFHHEFPQDFRNAIFWHQYDPTKWLITILSAMGLAYNLKTFSTNEVTKGMIQMKEKKLRAMKDRLSFGTPISELPLYTWDEFQSLVLNENKKWIMIEGVIYDVEGFDHPGGEKYMSTSYGKDVTTAFNGGVYNHSNGARNLLTSMRVAVIKGGMQVMCDSKSNVEKTD